MLSKGSQLPWPYTALGWKGHLHMPICLKVMTGIFQFVLVQLMEVTKVTSSLGFSGKLFTPPKTPQKHLLCLLSPGNTSFSGPMTPSGSLLWPPRHDFMSSVFRSHALSTRRCQLSDPRLVIFREWAPVLPLIRAPIDCSARQPCLPLESGNHLWQLEGQNGMFYNHRKWQLSKRSHHGRTQNWINHPHTDVVLKTLGDTQEPLPKVLVIWADSRFITAMSSEMSTPIKDICHQHGSCLFAWFFF